MILIENIKSPAVITDPWQYKIADNVFDNALFTRIVEAAEHLSNYAEDGGNIRFFLYKAEKLGVDPETIKQITQAANKLLENVDSIVSDFPYQNISKSGYFTIPHFTVSGNNFTFPIHTDSIQKTLTLAVYVSPQTHTGTRIYNGPTEEQFETELEWKPNRAFILAPCKQTADSGWHTWNSYTGQPRVTLNISCQRIETLQETMKEFFNEDDMSDGIPWVLDQFGQNNLIRNKL